MKKIVSAIVLMILVWGCSKKMTPAKSETPTSNIQALSTDTNPGNATETFTTTTVTKSTSANSATNSTQASPIEATPEASAAIAGQATFNAKCNRCHGLKITSDYTAERWASILVIMATRANLTETEKANVYAYVKENAKK